MSRTHVDIQRILLGGMGLSSPYTSAVRGCKGRCGIFRSIVTHGFRQAENLQGKAALSLQLQYLCDDINGFQYSSVTGIPQKGSGMNLSSKRTEVAECSLCPSQALGCSTEPRCLKGLGIAVPA